MPRQTRKATHNSTYKKLAVQWLNEALCSVSSFVVADSFVLRNRQLLVAANRQAMKKPRFPLNQSKKAVSICTKLTCKRANFWN
jgi:hypothetical protein